MLAIVLFLFRSLCISLYISIPRQLSSSLYITEAIKPSFLFGRDIKNRHPSIFLGPDVVDPLLLIDTVNGVACLLSIGYAARTLTQECRHRIKLR